jgi:predicted HTH transcriptional regulator
MTKFRWQVLKTVTAFLNAGGGTLLIGVSDDGSIVGLAADGFLNEDKMSLHLVNLIRDRIGDVFPPYVHPDFVQHEGGRVLSVRCERGPKAAFVKDGTAQKFFVRAGNATIELMGPSIIDYCSHRFK